MKLKFTLSSLILIGCSSIAKGQYAADMLKFSQQDLSGTARYMSIGGAQTALGGDLGTLSGNPAGAAMYRSSDASLSLQFNGNKSEGSYMGAPKTAADHNNFRIANAGAVFNLYSNKSHLNGFSNEWVGVNLGIGYNRSNDFYGQERFSGFNSSNSITQSMAEQASAFGTTNDKLPNYLGYAYDAKLIQEAGTDGNGNTIYAPISEGNVNQKVQNITEGSQSETNINISANYGNRLLIGASASFWGQNYYNEQVFKEDGYNGNPFYTNPNEEVVSLTQHQYQSVSGNGYSGKVGAIFRATSNLNIGGSVDFPVSWNMYESYSYDVSSTKKDGSVYNSNYDIYNYEYKFTTPFHYNVGMSYFIGKNIFVSADMEFIDYSKMKFKADDWQLEDYTNQDIQTYYKKVVNLHLGAEMKVKQFCFRAGFAHYGNPYVDNLNMDGDRQYYTAGIGYRKNDFYIDLTYVYSSYYSTYRPYFMNDYSEPVVDVFNSQNTVSCTIGTRF